MSTSSAVPLNTAEAVRDLQERVGRFARTTGVISGVMLVAALVNSAVAGAEAAPIPQSSRFVHVLATALALGVWVLARGKTLKATTIQALDAALTLSFCICWALLGIGIATRDPVEFSIILATTYTLIARSVIVPSTFLRTLVLSLVCVVPTIIFFFVRHEGFIPNASPSDINRFLMFAVLWCLVAAFTAALQSRQLYGLRRRIQEASKLGQYTLEEKIGEGGMGVVYRATHALLRRPAAIKLLLSERAGERELARFEREVQHTSQLMHPNTISIFDYGRTADGTFYYVMEFLDGFDLEWLVKTDGPLEPARAIRILVQASGALAEAHGLGLIHRDIKPANIILTARTDEPDIAKVVDFGLVKALEGNSAEPAVTNAQAITGTPLYLAPEAITAPDTVNASADLYALGAVGYYLVTGKHVFEGASIVEVCSKHLLEAPVPPSVRLGRPIPADLEAIILACLAKAPKDRPASAAVLREALLKCAAASEYDPAVGARWWSERAGALRTRRSTHPSAPEVTMAVDLDHRSRAASTL